MIYLGAILLGFSTWLLVLEFNPQVALQKRTLHISIAFTLFLVFAVAMYEVQIGLIASLNDVLSRYASY